MMKYLLSSALLGWIKTFFQSLWLIVIFFSGVIPTLIYDKYLRWIRSLSKKPTSKIPWREFHEVSSLRGKREGGGGVMKIRWHLGKSAFAFEFHIFILEINFWKLLLPPSFRREKIRAPIHSYLGTQEYFSSSFLLRSWEHGEIPSSTAGTGTSARSLMIWSSFNMRT